jgi:hypothetical protein
VINGPERSQKVLKRINGIELELMRNLKLIDPSISWVNWNHLKNIHTIPEQHTGKYDIKEVYTAALLGTAYIHWKTTNVKAESIKLGNNIRYTKRCNHSVVTKLRLRPTYMTCLR